MRVRGEREEGERRVRCVLRECAPQNVSSRRLEHSVGKNRPLVSMESKLQTPFTRLKLSLFLLLDVLCLIGPPFRANNKYFVHCTCTPSPLTVPVVTVYV